MSNPENNYHTLSEAAHLLKTGKNTLLELLRENQILNAENIPYRKYRMQGLFAIHKMPHTIRSTGIQRWIAKTVVTKSGIAWINELLNRNNKVNATKQRKREKDRVRYQQKKSEEQAWKLVLSASWHTPKPANPNPS